MKKSVINIQAIFLTLLVFGCGEERFPNDYTEYNPQVVVDDDGAVSYQNFETYPVLETITSEAPIFDLTSTYKFQIDTIKAPSGSAFLPSKMSINAETGVISYDNSAGNLSPGAYVFTVGLETAVSLARYNDIVTMTVNEVPIDVTIDNATVDVGSLEQGVIGTVAYSDNSGAGLITSVSFELSNPPANFEIDANTGVIRKTGAVDEGEQLLSVRVVTNLGTIIVNNLLTVNVGPPPTIAFFQQDETSALTQVLLSPWTAYMTSTPTLDGMTATAWAIILPETLSSFSDAISIQSGGVIAISAEADLPLGDHLIGVTATNAAGVSKDFPELFTLTVETRWTLLEDDQIDGPEANVLPETVYPGIWTGYDISGASTRGGWMKVAGVGAGKFSGMRRWDPGTLDACLVRTLDITGVKALRVSFGELIGYGGAFTNRYDRAFYFGESVTSLAESTFVDSEWIPLIAPDGPWQSTNWNGGTGPENEYSNINVDLTTVTSNTLYLNWRLFSKDVAAGNQNGQFLITYLIAEQSSAFPAEEK